MPPETDVTPSSPPPASFRLRWDVFLSFRGTDTRHTFTKDLYNALHARGVRVFRDDDGLGRGDEIKASLLEAIDDSAASVIVLSEDYASSRWCLEELAKICDCGRLILPVFYRVDPSDVRKQKGPFEGSFKSHAERFEAEKVQLWRDAMAKVGGIAGWVCQENSDSDKLIRVLVETVMKQMRNTPLSVAQYTVGVDDKVEELKKLLDVKINDVRVLGLYGMGGVGKTTLAKSLFNTLVVHFERRSFISNVREVSRHGDGGGLVSLQNRILGDLSSGGTVNDVNDGVSAIKRVLQGNKVLLILDDVDEIQQLDFLMGNREWFHKGSRVVITTRNTQVLPESYVDMFYEVRELELSAALALFCHHAMRRKKPAEGFSNLSKQIVKKTGGLPLALEVIGSFLFDKRTSKEWKDALERLKQIPHPGVQDVLKISYDALDEQEQCIFLDIACLFVQMEMERDDVVDILNGCNFNGEIAITVLTAKCLIKITTRNVVWMHDQVRDMGRQIVQNESLTDYGLHSRLWDRDQILTVLKSNKQKPSCKSASAFIKEKCKKYMQDREEKAKEVVLQTKHFQPMVSLRLLQINYSRLEGQFKCLPPGLKWLQWKQCPLRNLPSSYNPLELAVIDLSESKIGRLWGRRSNKVAKHLMVLKLSRCHRLTATPDLSGYLSLKKIVLEECSHLTRIHESLGNLSTLIHLNLHQCYNLVEVPADVSGLKHLEDLILSGCWKLKALPTDISCMISLKQLVLDETAITELPGSIFHLTKLEKLSADKCQFLKRLPTCIGNLCSLQELSLNNTALEELPDSVGCLENLELLGLVGCRSLSLIPNSVGKLISLKRLHFDVTGIKELPDSIGSLSYLRKLSVAGCSSLDRLPLSIEALVSIAELQLDGTSITNLPDQVRAMKMLKKLEMRNCQHLRFLPASIGFLSALTTLDMYNTNITELPDSIGMLENLTRLRLDMCKQLQMLPASMGNLKSLQRLLMKETAVTHLPDSFRMLSSLVELQMERRPYLNAVGNNVPPIDIISNKQEEPNSESILTSFCNLTMLEQLNFHGWSIFGKIPDNFENLSSLETLSLGHNNICSLPASMRGLSYLKKLYLQDCRELMLLPPLPSSLEELNIANCTAVEYISDISNLDRLEEFNLMNCEKVVDIPGLEHLKSLRRLYMNGCIGCSLAVKRRFSKVLLKKLKILIMPGSRIPDWFSGESVVFSKRRNRELKGIICAGVLSFNNIPEDQRDKLQLMDVQGKVFNLTDNVYSTTFRLLGVPRTNEHHIFLRRFGVHTSLVFELKDRCTLHLTKRNPPYVEGLELKNCGIYLVFEGDDDFEGDEGSLEEGQYSVSQKLAKFFNTSAEGDPDLRV
ncbi:disease resistance protein RPV1-like isoform X2 [Lotus japonicus]|uniref:disease resistance protein RPV1-like isoform X2 n=1 Tax=Lotus japonicus TaxID=34305 RepID=UPI00258F435F|nr:disease resistance protein RPV1-like isoform X2 [Lotus japonicus]